MEDDERNLLLSLGWDDSSENNIIVTVNLTGSDDIAALSLRLTYDSNVLTPVEVDWPESISNSGSTFHFLDEVDVVPLAFVANQELDVMADEVELCRIHFIRIGPGEIGVSIINDAEYLIALDLQRDRLPVITGGGM